MPPLPICLNILAIWAYWRRRLLTSCTCGAAAGGDALAAGAGDDLVIAALLGGHRVDDGLQARELLFIHILRGLLHSGEGADRGQHLEDRLHRAELPDLAQLVAEIFEREAVAEQRFLGQVLGFLAVERGFGLLDQRHHVAHAEDAADDAVGMEWLEGVRLFADADELDGLAGDVANGERRAAACIAVHLGEDDAGEAEALVEVRGRVDRVLAGHGVGDEENLAGVEQLFQPLHLAHQLFVDVQAAGGIDDERVAAHVAGLAAGLLARRSTSAEPAASPFWSPS